jgi:hypothetical protein
MSLFATLGLMASLACASLSGASSAPEAPVPESSSWGWVSGSAALHLEEGAPTSSGVAALSSLDGVNLNGTGLSGINLTETTAPTSTRIEPVPVETRPAPTREETTDPTQESEPDPFTPTWGIMALVGSRGMGGDAHLFGGTEASVHPLGQGRFGLTATGHLGRGNDYRSSLLGAGPSARLGTVGGIQATAWAGVGHYREELQVETAPLRRVTGALVGLTLRRPLGPGAVSLQVSWLGASMTEADFVRSQPIHGFRLALGVGR